MLQCHINNFNKKKKKTQTFSVLKSERLFFCACVVMLKIPQIFHIFGVTPEIELTIIYYLY